MDKQLVDNQQESVTEPESNTERKPAASKTSDKLKQIAIDWVDGKLFTHMDIKDGDERLGQSIFMPLLFGATSNLDINTVGLVFEYLDKAEPRCINGYPIFFSMQYLNREDTVKMQQMAQKYHKLKTEFATDV